MAARAEARFAGFLARLDVLPLARFNTQLAA
jgi:hypothetical protein